MGIVAWTLVLGAGALGMLAVPFGLSGQLFLPAVAGLWLLLPVDPASDPFTGRQVLFVAIAALLAEVVEAISGVIGGKKAGGSRRAAWWGFFGGFAGAILGTIVIPVPIVGSLVGVLGGTFLGAALAEHSLEKKGDEIAKVGTGAMLGRLVGILFKGAVSVGIFAYAVLEMAGWV